MRIRNSVKLFAVTCLALCAALFMAPRAFSFYADAVQYLGRISWLSNGSTVIVQAANSSGEMKWASTQNGLHFLVNQTSAAVVTANSTLTTGSTDTAGSIRLSSTNASTMTFVNAWSSIPFCVANSTASAAAVQVIPSTTQLGLSLAASSNATINYVCFGK